jgi:hypothetical protein
MVWATEAIPVIHMEGSRVVGVASDRVYIVDGEMLDRPHNIFHPICEFVQRREFAVVRLQGTWLDIQASAIITLLTEEAAVHFRSRVSEGQVASGFLIFIQQIRRCYEGVPPYALRQVYYCVPEVVNNHLGRSCESDPHVSDHVRQFGSGGVGSGEMLGMRCDPAAV